jgi:hypothetical protein
MMYQEFRAEMCQLDFANILVTGPQRSGTTIAAHMIAHDLDMCYVDEDDLGWHGSGTNDESLLRKLLAVGVNNVIQAPACAHICHTLPEDCVVVFMRRDVEDVVASEERIKWGCERVEFQKYPEEYRATPISHSKYLYWEEVQRDNIAHAYEVEYDSLRGHPLWVEKEHRKNFGTRQYGTNGYAATREGNGIA